MDRISIADTELQKQYDKSYQKLFSGEITRKKVDEFEESFNKIMDDHRLATDASKWR